MEALKTSRADLENKKSIFGEIGLLISLLIVFLAFNWKTSDKSYIKSEKRDFIDIQEEMIPVTIQTPTLPSPPQTRKAVVIKIVENDIDVENDIVIDAEANQKTEMEAFTPYVPMEIEEEETIEEETIFIVVESMPEFPGGMNKLMKYLQDNLKYPVRAKELGIQGKVYLSFVVEKDGSVTDVALLRGIGGGCDEEAIRAVKNMPKWIPGKQRNIPVRVRFNLPVNFKLL